MLYEDALALSLPTAPRLFVLAGGEELEQLKASGPPVGSRVSIAGDLDPGISNQPSELAVRSWKELGGGEVPDAETHSGL